MKHLCGVVLLLLVAVSASAAVTDAERKLMVKFGQGDASEVELAKAVQPKASTAAVGDFATRMVLNHTKAFDALQQIAKAEGVTLTKEMDKDHKKFAAQLAKTKHGAAYDRTYAAQMVKDHRKDTADVKKAIAKITNPEFAAWARNELTTVEHHLQMAQQLERQLR